MTDLVISGNVLEKVEMTPSELLTELAVFLYEKERLSIGKARKLAGLDLIAFQKELAKRDVYIHYDIEDFHKDIENLNELDQ